MKNLNMFKNSINSFVKAYPAEKSSVNYANLWRWLFVNPISIFLAYVLSLFRIQPNLITLFSLVIGLTAIYNFFNGYFIEGALLINLAYLFDCVDGHLARYYKKTSKDGKYLDDIVGIIIWSFSWIAIGFGLYNNSDKSLIIILEYFNIYDFNNIYLILFGVIAGYTSELRTLIASKYNEVREEDFLKVSNENTNNKYSSHGFFYLIFKNLISIGGFIGPILIISSFFNFLSITITLYSVLFLSVFIFYCVRYYYKLVRN